jgi:hypothetical protein
MNTLIRSIRALAGLFVDDGKLALTIVAVLILVGLLTRLDPSNGSSAMAVLVIGTVSALLVNVVRTTLTHKR